MLEHAVLDQDAARVAVARVEEIAVDACNRRRRADAFLHVRDALAADDRVVRQHGQQRVETAGPRCVDDVQHDGPMGREFDLPRVRHAGHEEAPIGSLCTPGRGRDQTEEQRDDQAAEHDPASG